jgi:hypothetical protein
MTHSDLRVEVQGPYILVAMRGTCLRAKFRKQEAPWLATDEYEEDSEASITFKEFRTLAWEAVSRPVVGEFRCIFPQNRESTR